MERVGSLDAFQVLFVAKVGELLGDAVVTSVSIQQTSVQSTYALALSTRNCSSSSSRLQILCLCHASPI